jgi:hypothetical protein
MSIRGRVEEGNGDATLKRGDMMGLNHISLLQVRLNGAGM